MEETTLTSVIQKFSVKKHTCRLYKPKTVHDLLTGSFPWSLPAQDGYGQMDCLSNNIRDSVKQYTRNKDTVIQIYRDLAAFLKSEGLVIDILFPPVPVSVSFERQMFIAKYLQDSSHKVTDLEDILWVSSRTIEDDLRRLRGEDEDPIQVCGNRFCIPDFDRENGSLLFPSTAHPMFLTPNLTQVLVMLKGLKEMSRNPLYETYAVITARDIWTQLSEYAKDRIRFVLQDLLPEDLTWYEFLEEKPMDHFYSEKACSHHNVILDCIKNEKSFCVQYKTDQGILFLKDCAFVPNTYHPDCITVTCQGKNVVLYFDRVLSSAYTPEELL